MSEQIALSKSEAAISAAISLIYFTERSLNGEIHGFPPFSTVLSIHLEPSSDVI